MIEIQRVLCPIDFSEFSRRALDHAITLARWYRARLTLLHVYHLAPLAPMAPEVTPALMLTPEYRESLLRELGRFAEPAGADAVALELALAEGDAGTEILTRAADEGSDLIVLGSRGRTGIERFVLGSVTEKVLRKAACPVLTIPVHDTDLPPAAQFKQILCAVDFSPCSTRAIEYALSLAQEADGCLTLLHVFEAEAAMAADWRETLTPEPVRQALVNLEAERRECLARAVPVNLQRSCSVESIMVGGKPSREILRLADERNAGLIVLGVQGRSAADRLVFGSTTQEVLRQASRPVLTIKSR
jgi:nucleotide-binding universal stress UspA family protein